MANRRGRGRVSVARDAEGAASQSRGKKRRSVPTSKGLAESEIGGVADSADGADRDSDLDRDVATEARDADDCLERPKNGESTDLAAYDGAAAFASAGRDSDDGDAPDDVPFVQSKELAAAAARDARDSASRGKRALKTKRRERDEKYKQQKVKKLEAIMSHRLPDEVLQSLGARPVVASVAKSATTATVAAVSAAADSAAGDDGASDPEANAEPDVGGAAAPDSTKAVGSDGFIPLSSDGASSRYRVSVVKDVRSVRDGKAVQFMERFRCGGARVQREAFSALASKREKRRARLS